MTCFTWMLTLVGVVLFMVSLIRWFEQVTEAVELRWWNKVFVLVVAPFTTWLFPARVAAGRPMAVPRHEPVRGFGSAPLMPKAEAQHSEAPHPPQPTSPSNVTEGPPPGTPKEFIGLPKIPPRNKRAKPAVDPEQLAKLKQKMREQGMLPDEE